MTERESIVSMRENIQPMYIPRQVGARREKPRFRPVCRPAPFVGMAGICANASKWLSAIVRCRLMTDGGGVKLEIYERVHSVRSAVFKLVRNAEFWRISAFPDSIVLYIRKLQCRPQAGDSGSIASSLNELK